MNACRSAVIASYAFLQALIDGHDIVRKERINERTGLAIELIRIYHSLPDDDGTD